MLTVLGNYTFINANYNEKVDHGFYNESTGLYSGTLGMYVDLYFLNLDH